MTNRGSDGARAKLCMRLCECLTEERLEALIKINDASTELLRLDKKPKKREASYSRDE